MSVVLTRRSANRTTAMKVDEEQPIDRIWRRYKKNLDEATRNRLIERYFPLVCYMADRLHARLPRVVDVGDLIQQGSFGLMDAIDAFDPDNGAKFETFCAKRVNGAMLDYLRSVDDLSRGGRERQRLVEAARQTFFASHGYYPTELELLPLLHPRRRIAERILDGGKDVKHFRLAYRWKHADAGDEGEVETIADSSQPEPLQAVQKKDIRNFITRNLSRVERLIVILYYYEELSMKEIGCTLGLSESRVSQMHKSIMARLRAQLGHRELELSEA